MTKIQKTWSYNRWKERLKPEKFLEVSEKFLEVSEKGGKKEAWKLRIKRDFLRERRNIINYH